MSFFSFRMNTFYLLLYVAHAWTSCIYNGVILLFLCYHYFFSSKASYHLIHCWAEYLSPFSHDREKKGARPTIFLPLLCSITHLIFCSLFLSSSSVSLFVFFVGSLCLCPPVFYCWLYFSLVKHPRASSCLWTSVNWMLVLGRVRTSSSWCPLSPFAMKSIPRAPFSTYPSALSWTSSLRLSLS